MDENRTRTRIEIFNFVENLMVLNVKLNAILIQMTILRNTSPLYAKLISFALKFLKTSPIKSNKTVKKFSKRKNCK